MEKIKCYRCHEIKPLSEFSFYKYSKHQRQGYCKQCAKTYNHQVRKPKRLARKEEIERGLMSLS
jgi:hypothetical protein